MDSRTEQDKKAQYKLTKSPKVQKVSDIAGQSINVTGYCFYTDKSGKSDTDKMILTMVDDAGNIYGTDSKTAQENFSDILDFFEEDIINNGSIPVMITTSTSKNNRTFVQIEYCG